MKPVLGGGGRLAGNHKIVTYLDDSVYWSRSINVHDQPPQVLEVLGDSIDQVLLAIPSLPRSERRRIVDHLQSRGIAVLQVPSVDDLTSGRARIDALRPIAIEDLLGRDEVPVDPQLLGPGICDAVVCVTGAGGSIGSELCRQILTLSPERLILLESSEPALYAIEQELRELVSERVVVKPVLGGATDPKLLKGLFTNRGCSWCSMLLLINMCPLWRPIPWRAWPITSAPLTRFVLLLLLLVCVG